MHPDVLIDELRPTVRTAADVATAVAADAAWRTERCSYRDLCDRKRETFWRTKVDADRSSPCLLYTSPSPRDGLLSRMPSSA